MKSRLITLVALLILAGFQILVAQTSKTREVSPFTEISLKIGANVHLKQGKTQLVEIKCEESTAEKLITEVNGKTLVIRYKSETWFSSWHPGEVDVYITIPQIDGLYLSGSGSIISEGEINSRILDVVLSGSGEVKLAELKADKVSSTLSGSGNIRLSGGGNATEFKAIISGSGNIKAIDFPAGDVNVKISGSGNCTVNAEKNLVVRLSGSGNVTYKGNPAIDTAISGSGKVKPE